MTRLWFKPILRAGRAVTRLWFIALPRAGRAVAACPKSIAMTVPWSDLVTRPVRGLAPAVAAVCCRADDRNPIVRAFVACAREVAAGG